MHVSVTNTTGTHQAICNVVFKVKTCDPMRSLCDVKPCRHFLDKEQRVVPSLLLLLQTDSFFALQTCVPKKLVGLLIIS